MTSIDSFIKDFSEELQNQNGAIFAGAGLSAPSGFVNWKELLADIATDLGLDINKENDLVSLAQYHLNKNGGNRSSLNKAVINNFSSDNGVTENHQILTRLPVNTYWTTNYDRLIEKALEAARKIPDVKHEKEDLVHTVPDRDAIVYKMHGDAFSPNSTVITKEDYEFYDKTRGPFITALAGDFVSKTFLFLGFSFMDPNLNFVLSKIRAEFGNSSKHHYCILKKESKLNDDDVEYEYRKVQQEHFVNDLMRYNIRAVLIDSYDQITDILIAIEKRIKKDTVFISGAAHDYSPFSEEEALNFTSHVSQNLIKRNFKVVSGLGLGVGSSVIDGALKEIYINQQKTLKNQLIIRPVPQSNHAKQAWTKYREDMLDYSGIAIFMFGNKMVDGEIIDSNGVEEEFEIAKRKNLLLIPIGFTGSVAANLWSQINKEFEEHYPNIDNEFKIIFKCLGDNSLNYVQKIQAVDKLLEFLHKHIK